jgi:hypothetical protein
MINEKYSKDISALEAIAKMQNNKLNLSIILITLKCKDDELQDILDHLSKNDIEIINEDVEPESDGDGDDESHTIDNKVNPFDPSKIDIKMDKMTMDSLIKRIKNKELEFDSSFQRKAGLWKKNQKSQLIESMLLKIPLPAFYFDASNDDKWLIIDGLQRIGTIKEFVVDESFPLTGMEFLKELNGLKFSKLPRALQRRIEETNINAYLINPATPKNVKFNIFKRINTGGLVLETQEIRNALYQGQATEFINKLAKTQSFITATDGSIKTDRMLDREFCLRYVAFTELQLEQYTSSLEFLNKAMDFLSKTTIDRLNNIENRFINTMDICKLIFGKNAFRKIDIDGRRRPVNKALFEGWSYIMVNLDEKSVENLIKDKEKLIEEFIELCNQYSFQNALRASDKTSLNYRLSSITSLVNKILLKE